MKSKPSFVVRRAKRSEDRTASPWLVCDLRTMWSESYPSRRAARAMARHLNEQKKCVPSR